MQKINYKLRVMENIFRKGSSKKCLHFVTNLAYIYDTMPYKLFFYNIEKVLGYFYECMYNINNTYDGIIK